MMWSAFLFPVLFWLARRPAEAALAAFVPVAYFGAITAVFFGEAAFQPAAAAALSRNRGLHRGRLSSTLPVAYPWATGGEHDRVSD